MKPFLIIFIVIKLSSLSLQTEVEAIPTNQTKEERGLITNLFGSSSNSLSENGDKSALIFIHGLAASLSSLCQIFAGPLMGLSSSDNIVRCPKAPYDSALILPPSFLTSKLKLTVSWFNFWMMPAMSVLSPVAGESREGMDRALQTIEEEIEDLIINHNVPSENIVVAGASQGGVLTIWCALYCKRKLGGFLPIVTWLPLRKINDITQISPPPINKDTPIMHMNGLLDPIVPAWPAAKKTEEEMEKVFTNYELKLVPGTHGTSIGPHTTPLMVRWAKKNTNLKFSNWNPIAWIPGRK